MLKCCQGQLRRFSHRSCCLGVHLQCRNSRSNFAVVFARSNRGSNVVLRELGVHLAAAVQSPLRHRRPLRAHYADRGIRMTR